MVKSPSPGVNCLSDSTTSLVAQPSISAPSSLPGVTQLTGPLAAKVHTLSESMFERACQHCDWFRNIHQMFVIDSASTKIPVQHIEARTVHEPNGRPRHCHLFKPVPGFVPSNCLLKSHKDRTCVLLWFGKVEYEGLDFDYYLDKNGSLWDGDDDKIISEEIPLAGKNTTRGSVERRKKRPRAGRGCSPGSRAKKSTPRRKPKLEIPFSPPVKVPSDEVVAERERWIQCALCKKWRTTGKKIANLYQKPNTSWFCWYHQKLGFIDQQIPERACTAAIEVCQCARIAFPPHTFVSLACIHMISISNLTTV